MSRQPALRPARGSISSLGGIACMVSGGLGLALNSAVAKFLVADYPPGQILFIRALFIYGIIAVLVWRDGGIATLRIRNYPGQTARALCLASSTYLMVVSVGLLPLGDVFAINHASPLILTAMAALFLGESVGWRRWTAILVGFAGILVMLRPTPAAFQWAALVPLLVALLSATRDVITRHITNTESSTAILAYSTTIIMLAGLATAAFVDWRPVAWGDLYVFALAALFQGTAHFLMIETFRLAEAKVVAPFKYSTILWAMIIGFLIWGDLPDAWIITGGALVVGSGLYILHRERRR
jgi:drug/metabolite transporter (DMT)-like permease